MTFNFPNDRFVLRLCYCNIEIPVIFLNLAVMQNCRIEVLLENPNELFVSWVEKWLREAEAKDAKSKYTLRGSLEALKSFPLPLSSGRECAILRGFGPTLCKLIDRKLEEHKRQHRDEFNKSLNYSAGVATVAKKCGSTRKPRKKRPQVKNAAVGSTVLGSSAAEQCAKLSPEEQIIMSPGDFEILLLVDTQETSGKNKTTVDQTRKYLDSQNVSYEIRRLGVGDFAWIARNPAKQELVLPYIVERKRMDDFASSIRDGRFHEQKHRLRESGVPNLIYLIENYGNNQHIGLPLPTLMQAATNTQIHSQFQIKFTDSHRDSILYLAVLTNILKEMFKDKALIGVPKNELKPLDIESPIIGLMRFQEFHESSSKNKSFQVKEVFIKQLLQLKSLSVDKALAITDIYNTPRSLILAYKNCNSQEEAENLLSNIPSGKLKRPVGCLLSKTLYRFYNTRFE